MDLYSDLLNEKRIYIDKLNSIIRHGTPDDKDHFMLAVQITVEAGITHNELAEALSVDRVNVTRWANRQYAPSALARRAAWPIILAKIEKRIETLCELGSATVASPQPHVPLRMPRRRPGNDPKP